MCSLWMRATRKLDKKRKRNNIGTTKRMRKTPEGLFSVTTSLVLMECPMSIELVLNLSSEEGKICWG